MANTHLKGNNSYTGPTTIHSSVAIMGSQPQSDVTVTTVGDMEANLYGAGGVMGNVIVNGELAPGCGIVPAAVKTTEWVCSARRT